MNVFEHIHTCALLAAAACLVQEPPLRRHSSEQLRTAALRAPTENQPIVDPEVIVID
jgi:hypothetical protein